MCFPLGDGWAHGTPTHKPQIWGIAAMDPMINGRYGEKVWPRHCLINSDPG